MASPHRTMSEDPSSAPPAPRSWLDRLGQILSGEPRNRAELLEELRNAQANGLLSRDTLRMIEGAIAVTDQQVADVMVPRSRMVTVSASQDTPSILKTVIESGHSRFPVLGEGDDDILGILLAKDLLKVIAENKKAADLRSVFRPVTMVPESKRLNVLLQEFRLGRHHMAIVVDEYGGVSGLVTIEDVLEEIVGDIDDEHDDADEGFIKAYPDGRFTISALTPIAEFNERFGANFSDEEFDTVGGLITAALGHVPETGEETDLETYHFKVTKADDRRVHQFSMRIADAA